MTICVITVCHSVWCFQHSINWQLHGKRTTCFFRIDARICLKAIHQPLYIKPHINVQRALYPDFNIRKVHIQKPQIHKSRDMLAANATNM